jgi:hypothetical protein
LLGDAQPALSEAKGSTTLTLMIILEKFILIEPRKYIQENFSLTNPSHISTAFTGAKTGKACCSFII